MVLKIILRDLLVQSRGSTESINIEKLIIQIISDIIKLEKKMNKSQNLSGKQSPGNIRIIDKYRPRVIFLLVFTINNNYKKIKRPGFS